MQNTETHVCFAINENLNLLLDDNYLGNTAILFEHVYVISPPKFDINIYTGLSTNVFRTSTERQRRKRKIINRR